jgi:NitT/TauT family transport system substrate-binding protein
VAAIAVGAAGCTGGDENDSSPDGTGTNDSGESSPSGGTNIDIAVSAWKAGVTTLPHAVALEEGLYKEEGINLSVIGGSGGSATLRTVASGDLPLGDVGASAVIKGYNAGVPLKVVSSILGNISTTVWVSPHGSDVEEITDLKGKRVAFTTEGSLSQLGLNLALQRADGISPDQVEGVAAGGFGEGLVLAEEGEVAATLHAEPFLTGQQLQAQQESGNPAWQIVIPTRSYLNRISTTWTIASPRFLNNNPGVVRRFLRARQRALELCYNEPATMYKHSAKYFEGFNDSVMKQALKRFTMEKMLTHSISIEGINTLTEGMVSVDLMQQSDLDSISWPDMIDQSYLPDGVSRIDPQNI